VRELDEGVLLIVRAVELFVLCPFVIRDRQYFAVIRPVTGHFVRAQLPVLQAAWLTRSQLPYFYLIRQLPIKLLLET